MLYAAAFLKGILNGTSAKQAVILHGKSFYLRMLDIEVPSHSTDSFGKSFTCFVAL